MFISMISLRFSKNYVHFRASLLHMAWQLCNTQTLSNRNFVEVLLPVLYFDADFIQNLGILESQIKKTFKRYKYEMI